MGCTTARTQTHPPLQPLAVWWQRSTLEPTKLPCRYKPATYQPPTNYSLIRDRFPVLQVRQRRVGCSRCVQPACQRDHTSTNACETRSVDRTQPSEQCWPIPQGNLHIDAAVHVQIACPTSGRLLFFCVLRCPNRVTPELFYLQPGSSINSL